MTSENPSKDVGTSKLLLNDNIRTIPQILHQEIIVTNGSPTTLSSTMDFIRKKRKIKFNTDSRLSLSVTVLLELLTFISIILYRWMHVHFMKKSDTYLICMWVESLVTIGLAQCLFRIFNLPKYTFMKNVSSLYPLFTLNGIIVVVHGYDFAQFTRKSGGSEFYQFSMVLFVPILLAVMYAVCTFKFPQYISNIISTCAILKITFLLQDPEFSLSLKLCIGGIIYSIIYSCYIICLKADLQKYTALELIYSLSVMSLLVLPVFIIERGEFSGSLSFKTIMVSVLSGSFKLGSLYFTFVLLKHTDPLKTLVTINSVYVPDHIMQALVYKLDCNISTCKVCFFILLDFIMGHFKRNVQVETTGERLKYSLMK